ncbi:MAG: hypothetical protein R3Y27_05635 [Clostridia bacterium]
MKDDERETFYTANSESIERFYELDNYLHEIGFKPKEFASEFKVCVRDLDLVEWKMNQLKVEIGRAEKLKRLVEEVARVNKVKRRDDMSL